MQAALMLRSKQRLARNKLRRARGMEIPCNVATREIPPWPRYPPETWVRRVYIHCLFFSYMFVLCCLYMCNL
jgi:hypothetical protein